MPRFQFTIRGLLGATFWLAVSIAAWTSLIAPRFRDTLGFYLLFIAAIIGPTLATVSLLGWTLTSFYLSLVWTLTVILVLWTTLL